MLQRLLELGRCQASPIGPAPPYGALRCWATPLLLEWQAWRQDPELNDDQSGVPTDSRACEYVSTLLASCVCLPVSRPREKPFHNAR